LTDSNKKETPREESGLEELVAKIRPLPENVVPSERFRTETRLRLLQLEAGEKRSTRKAA
jgi:hypothetical protein